MCAVFVYKIITNEAGKTTHNDLKPKDGIPNFKHKYPKSNETDKPKNIFKAQNVGIAIYYQIQKSKARDMNLKKDII